MGKNEIIITFEQLFNCTIGIFDSSGDLTVTDENQDHYYDTGLDDIVYDVMEKSIKQGTNLIPRYFKEIDPPEYGGDIVY